ncbi:hypothetical protein UA08_03962 [Talaromyces atroroseus]|uniref:endo-1,3(4)-beta-glucanase n=1 Tax=Talaromyces atroroseus TaxID=1441469 RepID=A0A1Q5Q9P9_TALAT|nr:hypothetical protein UA08_03962 [Talaromyces atroroseus]OKL60690.1 hypothetical protein UA08_03962 [Talaromyces atroroseus]
MPSSLISVATATLALVATPAVATSYSLLHNFDESNFFQNFSFYSDTDPTAGFVQYLDYEAAHDAGLATVKSGNVYLGADSTNTYSTGGRPSTRVESNFQFTQGLLIADLAHMPGNACGVWPAFWTFGENWPDNGEIDIIEGVSNQTANSMTLHTEAQCSISKNTDHTGYLYSTECSENGSSTGCQFEGTEGSFGDAFNTLGGGVYAMEWTSQHIMVWFFPRSSIPDSITSGNPDPSTFGTPMANFQGSCDFESDFKAQSIVFNIDFCGYWAGEDFGSSGCPLSNPSDATASCEAYVGANPSAFTEAYWEIASIKLYEQASGTSSPTSSSAAISSTTSSSSTRAIATSTPSKADSTSVSPIKSPSPSPSRPASFSSPAVLAASAVGAVGATDVIASPTNTPCSSSKSTITITSTITPIITPSATPSAAFSSKSIVPLTSARVSPSVNAVNASSSKLTTTTLAVTSYVDICPSGYTTKTITKTVTYCPAESSTIGVSPAFTTSSKFCATGCGPSPSTVVVVVPIESSTTTPSPTGTLEPFPTLVAVSTSATVSPSTISPSLRGTGFSSKFSSVTVPVPATASIRVPTALSSVTVPSVSKPSGSLTGSGSMTTSAVSPAYTGAASRASFSVLGLVAAMASFVLFL